ncbi:hypothetical protein EDI28_09600 [Photobacterium chitinilyticum]|uniref:Uncharacterized protein n=2 Tax=Photobacterium chitinilyticum TaxID=2485123 RepID=A0A3S3UM35_9GAMM|nr:hypothetical protein EDI28_09600 [Photobacterium chitinilyticum]
MTSDMSLSAVNFLPFTLLLAPISVFLLWLALKKKKVWLIRLALVGLVLAVLLLVVFQYLDYKHFENCLLQGANYGVFRGTCIQFD